MAAPILLPGLAKLLGCRGGLVSDETIEQFLVDVFLEKIVAMLIFQNLGPMVDFSESMVLAMQKALELLNHYF
jgi:hypothetical protein